VLYLFYPIAALALLLGRQKDLLQPSKVAFAVETQPNLEQFHKKDS